MQKYLLGCFTSFFRRLTYVSSIVKSDQIVQLGGRIQKSRFNTVVRVHRGHSDCEPIVQVRLFVVRVLASFDLIIVLVTVLIFGATRRSVRVGVAIVDVIVIAVIVIISIAAIVVFIGCVIAIVVVIVFGTVVIVIDGTRVGDLDRLN